METHIKIILATDDGFAMHTACLLVSILKNAEAHQAFTFYVLDGGLKPESKAKLESLKSVHDFEIHYLLIDSTLMEKLAGLREQTDARWGIYTFLRLLIPELLPDEDRLLYLDVDMIVRGSLEELWNMDLEGKSIAASLDSSELYPELSLRDWRKAILGLSKSQMFNAGMLLMDLKKIREENAFQTTIHWLEHFADIVLFVDQDGLNVIFRDDKKILSPIWNMSSEPQFAKYFTEPPVIIHYCMKKKPSLYQYEGLYKEEYWKYLRMTPWKDFRSPDRTWKNILRKRLGITWLIQRITEWAIQHNPWMQETLKDYDLQREDALRLRQKIREMKAKNTPWERYFEETGNS